MKLLTTLVLSSAAALLLIRPSAAAVMSRDWKTPGDGLLTYDDVNRREWLDLSQTVLSDQFPGADREAKYQFVIGQTGIGGVFDGFTPATTADVTFLAQSAGIDTSTLSYSINGVAAQLLCQLVSFTAALPTEAEASGLLDEVSPTLVRRWADFVINGGSQAGLSITNEIDRALTPPPGVLLYRNIPEPNGMALGVMGAIISTLVFRA